MDWVIHTVTWGEHTRLYIEYTLPAIAAAVKHAGINAQLLVHTDDAGLIERPLKATRIPFCVVPILILGDKYVICAACEDDAFHRAKPGQALAAINPDCVPSIELFTASQAALTGARRVVGIHSPRVVGTPPVGVSAAVLNQWNVDHFHPITFESFWGGRAPHPAHIYFTDGQRIVLHAFTYGPQVFLMDGRTMTIGTSRENALMDCYKPEEFALLLPSEAGFASITPIEENHGGFVRVNTVESVTAWFPHNVFHHHYPWIFPLQIPVLGDPKDIGDIAICREILEKIQSPIAARRA
jgi:hypothetical protein